jgi:hypothetical protein
MKKKQCHRQNVKELQYNACNYAIQDYSHHALPTVHVASRKKYREHGEYQNTIRMEVRVQKNNENAILFYYSGVTNGVSIGSLYGKHDHHAQLHYTITQYHT